MHLQLEPKIWMESVIEPRGFSRGVFARRVGCGEGLKNSIRFACGTAARRPPATNDLRFWEDASHSSKASSIVKNSRACKSHSDFKMARLYTVGRIQGHKRGKRNSTPHTTLIKVDGVENQKEAQFYLGKVSF